MPSPLFKTALAAIQKQARREFGRTGPASGSTAAFQPSQSIPQDFGIVWVYDYTPAGSTTQTTTRIGETQAARH